MAVGWWLVAAGVASGALAGFATGVAWSVATLPRPAPGLVAALVAAGAVADLARVPPPAVPRQVPRVWSEHFNPPVVAVLYGARLGVGPLTPLPTWLWWAAAVVAAGLGPGPSTAAGATFAAVRLLTVLVAAELTRPAMAVRMARLQGAEAPLRAATAVAAGVLGGTLLFQ